jgi:coenzyme F420-0:L-glutamate ligase / coenzyme F420-1:gamma-L-glutamate ligase
VTRVEVIAVTGIGEVRPGDDLATIITTAAPWLTDGDILVVTSKIVSKAEGQLVELPTRADDRDAAREAVLAAETARPVARRGAVRIVQTHHGLVMASAGIDASNVESGRLVLLPKDPDASARALRAALRERFKLQVAVVVTDTMGRPWRLGLTDTAIGAAGIDAVFDYRGSVDPYGNELSITQMAVIDELAAAGELVKGKSDQVPVAVVRGIPGRPDGQDGDGASVLVRRAEEDLFSLGTSEARAQGLRAAAELPDAARFGPTDPALVRRAAELVPFAPVPLDGLDPPPGTAAAFAVSAPDATPWAIAQTGALVQGVRARLAAEGLASTWLHHIVAGAPAGGEPLGVLAVGAPGTPSMGAA